MAIPAARALYEQGYEVDWVVGRAARPLLECYSWVRVIPADDKAIFTGSLFARVNAIFRFWSAVVSSRYDICATLYYDSRFRILTLPIRARRNFSLSRRSNRTRELLLGRSYMDEFVRILRGEQDSAENKALHRSVQMSCRRLHSLRSPRRDASRLFREGPQISLAGRYSTGGLSNATLHSRPSSLCVTGRSSCSVARRIASLTVLCAADDDGLPRKTISSRGYRCS